MRHRSELRYYGGNGSNITSVEDHNHYTARNFTVNSVNYSGAHSGATMQISLISEYIPIVGPYISGDVFVEVNINDSVSGYAQAN